MNNDLIINMVLKSWHSVIKRAEKLIDGLSDDELNNEIAPGKNRGIYLLGHLAAVNDMMLPLLGLGESQFPSEVINTFIRTPDNPVSDLFSVTELRDFLKKANANLAEQFEKLSPEEWLEKHTSVSDEDFKTQPHRNRLNVILSRTTHVDYHLGQLILLKG